MANKKNGATGVSLGIACVWMGTHFGPGVASGVQVNSYYVQYGIVGIVCSILAMCILGYALYCSMEFSRIYKTYDYKAWSTTLLGYDWVKWLYDLSFIVTCMTALGGSLNAVGSLLKKEFGINYWIGVGAVVICAMLLCAYGANLVRKASTYMMYVVLGVILLIVILAIVTKTGSFSEAQAAAPTVLPNNGKVLTAIWQAVIYAAFQATVVGNIASVAGDLKKRSESRKAAIIGIVGNAAMLIVLGLLLFSNINNVENLMGSSTPIYDILKKMNMSWLTYVYIITVFVAVLSTSVGFAFGGVARFSQIYNKGKEQSKAKDMIFTACLLLACVACSVIGIVKLVSVGYKILGYLNLPIFILAAIVIGGHKISKKYIQEKGIEAPGIDE
jgi:uncharacterized membrane protein YkvI